MLHISEDCFGKRYDQKYIKDGMVGPLGSRDYKVKRYKKYENKRMKDLKALKDQK